MRKGKYEIKRAKNGKYFFVLKSRNGGIMLTSQVYADKRGCKNGISVVQHCSQDADLFRSEETANKLRYFVLRARNHEVIARSECYAYRSGVLRGIACVMRIGNTDRILDLSK